ncbi:hypothetical protein CHS0354_015519 [Potamilus streckersoni]|uniref:Microsomal glutathione S-transferase 1 n=1 Tax=Potamilus streckersoni TaxID=2493646 RepID=A0AAE0SEN3_9BIVA|nr:hypothetical protein CHS0354_015519 [Potamilus streckersoni]
MANFNFDDPLFSQFAFYSGVVLMKTVVMSVWTARHRFGSNTFANPEDCKVVGDKTLKPRFDNQDVERVRRCHLNDLENVVPFVLIGMFYILSRPHPAYALLHFRIFAGARLFHTVAYLTPLPQPSRALAFGVGFLVNVSMAASVIMAGKF